MALAVLGLFPVVPAAAAAQEATIQGTVAASSTGRALSDVAVTLEAGGKRVYGSYTDENGRYRIEGIRPGTYTLKGQLIGYQGREQAVTLKSGEQRTINFLLSQAPVVLQGIVVSPQKGAAVKSLGRQIVTPQELHVVPVPGGSGDLASYLQTLPGVTTTGDRGGQVFVRGGTPSGNLVLVDGIPIYQPFHILGFYSVFPADLVSSADFYAGGFGARYSGRTSSVLDVHLRDGNQSHFRTTASLSPFLAQALAEGPAGGARWLISVRRSLVQQTSQTLLGSQEPVTFESEVAKVTPVSKSDQTCSVLTMHTKDHGQIDPTDQGSYVSWSNMLLGLRCITLRSSGQRFDVSWSYSGSGSDAVTHGSSQLHSYIWDVRNSAHESGLMGAIPFEAGWDLDIENMDYKLSELFGDLSNGSDGLFRVSGYFEAALPVGNNLEVRPGLVLTVSPRPGVEPRLRASWQPFGQSSGRLEGALGLYRQYVVGISDMRDVSSVFVAWMAAPDGKPAQALHAILGWQQTLGSGFHVSLEGYYKRLSDIPVPVLRGVAQFTTTLGRANGRVYGADTRLEYTSPRFYGFLGYGYSSTLYEASQEQFATWFGRPVLSYHPPHDRRHQINALASLDLGDYRLSARWQLGSGLPFTTPMGFDEAFDFTRGLPDVHAGLGTTRMVLNQPFTGRLPWVHRLDVSIERSFDLSFGNLVVQAGAINAYDRRNMFFYDLYTGRRLDQMPLAPYLSMTVRTK